MTDQKFTEVESETKVREFLTRAATLESICSWWVQTHSNRVCHSRVVEFDSPRMLITLSYPQGSIGLNVDAVLSQDRECLLSVYLLGEGVFCFKGYYSKRVENNYEFRLGDKVYRVQRRKGFRYQLPRGYEIDVVLGKEQFPLGDISAEGLSFFVNKDKNIEYKAGQKIDSMFFYLRQRRVEVEATVQHLSPYQRSPKESGIKVGVAFNKISEADTDYLSMYITEQVVLNFHPDDAIEGKITRK
jgi:hypothetical protein